jgi:outer membrane immunogenic protein
MIMKFAFIAAATVAALGSTSAFAADISGARVEGVIGYDSPKFDAEDAFDLEDSDIDIDIDVDGITYGIGLGYDFAVGSNLALGIDAEITDSTSDFEIEEDGDSGSIAFGRDLYIGARVTTALSESFNLYGKVGYTNQRAKVGYEYEDESGNESGNLDGIRAGIGGQFALAGNTYIGAEYRYSNYDSDISRHQVAATLGFRF